MVTLVAVIAIVGLAYVLRPGRDLDEYRAKQGELMARTTGLSRQVTNKLDAKFTDADGDLVADAPTDVSKQVDPDVIKFTYIAASNTAEMKAAFAPWVEFLAATTGKKVEYVTFESPDEQLVALRDGKIHVMAFNTGGVPIAVDAGGFVPVASLGDASGASKATVKLIASTRNGTPAGADVGAVLRGQELTLTEPTSNSGFKAPLVLLNDKGLVPGRDYAIRYSGGHTESIAGIAASGDRGYSFAAVASDVLAREQTAGRIKPENFKVVYESEKFPTAAFGYINTLKPELAEKVRKGLLDFKWEGTSVAKLFEGTGQTRVVPVNFKDDFALVRRIDDSIGFEHVIKDIPPDLTVTTSPTTEPKTEPAN